MNTSNNLYSQLLKSLYAVDGINAEFLGDLAKPIPFVPSDAKWDYTGRLAIIPSAVAADLQRQIKWHEEAIEELVEEALFEDEDFDFDDADFDDEPTETVIALWELQDGRDELRKRLKEL